MAVVQSSSASVVKTKRSSPLFCKLLLKFDTPEGEWAAHQLLSSGIGCRLRHSRLLKLWANQQLCELAQGRCP